MINRTCTLTIVILIVILFYIETALAEITIDGATVHVETDAYTVQFDRGVITYIYNKHTDETYTLSSGVRKQGWSGLLNHRYFWKDVNISTRKAALISAKKIDPLNAELLFRQGGTDIRLFIEVDPMTDDLFIDIEGVSDTPGVYGMQWGCENVDAKNLAVIAPVAGGHVIDVTTPITYRLYRYPGGWEAQLAVVQGERGGFFVRCTDNTFQFKRFIYDRDGDSFALNFGTHNQAPFDTLTGAKSLMWRFNTYTGDWRVPARQYRDWMEKTFNPRRLSDMPAWVEEIGLVVDGISLENVNVLDQLAELVDPTKTLLRVNARFEGGEWWRPGLVHYPDYKTTADFGPLVEAAHRHGFRVMPYADLLSFSVDHPLYPEFQQFQYRDTWTGELLGWQWDTASTHRHALINPASSAFRNILVQELKTVWQEYGVDAFFMDASHYVVNDANGLIEELNAGQGNALLHKELADAMPGVAFGGESLHEVTFFRESFAQRWKRSLEIKPHPISAFLFSPYTHTMGHNLPNPDVNPFVYQQALAAYESWGVLPSLEVPVIDWLREDRVETHRLLSIARTWQQFGLKPDFDSEWGPETLFQYIGQGGEVATYQRTPTGAILILPEGGAGYERVADATQVKTDRSLPGWYAYNETELLGLDPQKSYVLNGEPRDFSQPRISSLPEGVWVTEARVTENAALFRLAGTGVSYKIDLLEQFNFVRKGIEVDGADLPLQNRASFGSTATSISGIRREAIGTHPPWQELGGGNVFGEWTLSLPDSPTINLEFDMGLVEEARASDGVTFIVSIQGDEIFRQHYTERRWQHVTLDLTHYRDQQVILRLTNTPGPDGDTGQDAAGWGEPQIISELVGRQIGFFLPRQPIKSFPDTVRYIGGGQYILELETELPPQILFLFDSAQQVVPPHNLWETPFVAGFQHEGIFLLGRSFWGSGQRGGRTAGGVEKEIIGAHPPNDGQTVSQFLLSLPQAQKITFSFSMALTSSGCSTGIKFQVRLNGQTRFEHATSLLGWTDAKLSLSEFAGETVLLELVTDPDGSAGCDRSAWADLFITTGLNPDANIDGEINVLDLIIVAGSLGQEPPSNPQADTNKDGVVNLLDLVFVAENLSESAAAPAQMDNIKPIPRTAKEIIAAQRALSELEVIPNKSQGVQLAIELLRHFLSLEELNVEETKLLPNYPNPFNPETWIPYQLSEESTVTVKIYDVSGHLVRTIGVGHKPVGYYLTRERAVYWDGRNEKGESVSSGVYFYTLNTDTYTQTRRMVIVK